MSAPVPHDASITAPNAAVLVLLCRTPPSRGGDDCGAAAADPSSSLSFLLTERSRLVRIHRGEVSFPGGKSHRDDTSLLMTALRETHEEIGVDPRRVRILGQFHEYRPMRKSSSLRVATFIGYLDDRVEPLGLALCAAEVHRLFVVPRAELEASRERERDSPWPMFTPAAASSPGAGRVAGKGAHDGGCTGGKIVWGMTARILDDVLALKSMQ